MDIDFTHMPAVTEKATALAHAYHILHAAQTSDIHIEPASLNKTIVSDYAKIAQNAAASLFVQAKGANAHWMMPSVATAFSTNDDGRFISSDNSSTFLERESCRNKETALKRALNNYVASIAKQSNWCVPQHGYYDTRQLSRR